MIHSLEDDEKLGEIQQIILSHHQQAVQKSSDQYEQLIEDILAKGNADHEPLLIRQTIPSDKPAHRLLEAWSGFSFFMSFLSLFLLGLTLTYGVEHESPLEDNYYLWCYLCLNVLAWIDYGIFFFHWEAHPSQTWWGLAAALFPPLRLGRRHTLHPEYIWLPFWHWCKANDALFDALRRKFSTPMIIIALFIVPILLIEMRFEEQARAAIPHLDLYIFFVQSFIWIAFTFEFILMFSITNEKIDYCKKHWMDLLIILLPLISFFRTLRVLRVLKLQQVSKVYRFRGVFMKVRNALLLADAVQRILYPNPSAQLKSLQKKLKENARQRKELERQVLIAVERYRKKQEKKKAKS